MSHILQSLCVAALALAALASPAAAQPSHPDAVRSGATVQVFYGDLDTNSPAGAKVLVGRIKSAARSVCGSNFQARGMAGLQQRACEAGVASRAVSRVNNPIVTDTLASRTEQPRMIVASR